MLDGFIASGRDGFARVPDPGSDPDNPTYNLGYTTANWAAAYNGLISIPGVALVRRTGVGAANPPDPRTRFPFLNPAAGCPGFHTVTITPATPNPPPPPTCSPAHTRGGNPGSQQAT